MIKYVIQSMLLMIIPGILMAQNTLEFIDRTSQYGFEFSPRIPSAIPNRLADKVPAMVQPFDFDNDGDLDLFLAYGPARKDTSGFAVNRLYRNDGQLFTDITVMTNLHLAPPAASVAVGDVNGDGFLDLYLSTMEADVLLLNDSGRVWLDVTGESGIDNPYWSTGAQFMDANRDGALDLYIANYLRFPEVDTLVCKDLETVEVLPCDPEIYPPAPNKLYLGDGSGRFRDATEELGFIDSVSRSIGTLLFDANGDNLLDLLVLSHRSPNLLYLQQTDTTYVEVAWTAGLAVAADGTERAWQQALSLDADQDGYNDLLMIDSERSIELFLNHGRGQFLPGIYEAGLYRPNAALSASLALTLDANFDGSRDLLIIDAGNDTIPSAQHMVYSRLAGPFQSHEISFNLTVDTLLAVPVAEVLPDSIFDEFLGDVTGPSFMDFVPQVEESPEDSIETADTSGLFSLTETVYPGFWELDSLGYDSLFVDSLMSDTLGVDHGSDSTVPSLPPFEWDHWDTVHVRAVPVNIVVTDLNGDGSPELLATYAHRLLKIWTLPRPRRSSFIGLIPISVSPGVTIIGARVEVTTKDMTQHFLVNSPDPILISLPPRTREASVRIIWPDGALEHYQITDLNRYYTLTYQGAN